MAAPMKNKNVVSKDSLRRLMKEKSSVGKGSSSRIDHPCAKYNALEQLTCILCKTVVKNDRLWNAHIMGRTHKETVAALKHKATNQDVAAPAPSNSSAHKRRPPETDDDLNSKRARMGANGNASNGPSTSGSKNSIPDDFFDTKSKPKSRPAPSKKAQPTKSILKNATIRLPNYGESSTQSDQSESESEDETPAPAPAAINPATRTDIAKPVEGESRPIDPSMADKLPEGFFDDPKADAQVRQVEYKDKMEEEWDLFQKVMKEQNTVSEQIQEEDDEQKTLERQVEEVDEQMHRWSQIHALAQKKETVMADKEKLMDTDVAAESSDDDEADLDDLMDWRSKSS